jgi:nucleotide-binding universal stress UspA family protein
LKKEAAMARTIVVPLDGSLFARGALPFAAALARAAGARLLLVRAVDGVSAPDEDESVEGELTADARAEIGPLAEGLRDEGHELDVLVVRGAAAATILDVARSVDAWLIAMATHGRSGLGRWVYGSVADAVLRCATVPVLLVPAACQADWGRDAKMRVLVPLDGSSFAEAALGPADEVARLLNGDLALLQVVEPPPPSYEPPFGAPRDPSMFFSPERESADARAYLDGVAARWPAGGRVGACDVRIGDPGTEIVAGARARGAALIAMATHGRGGLPRAVLGSVATGTVQRAVTPVLLVRPDPAAP